MVINGKFFTENAQTEGGRDLPDHGHMESILPVFFPSINMTPYDFQTNLEAVPPYPSHLDPMSFLKNVGFHREKWSKHAFLQVSDIIGVW